MNIKAGIFLYLAVIVADTADFAAAQEPLTLRQCFSAASQYSAPPKIQSENIFQSKQQYREAIAGVLPDFRFSYSKTFRDNAGGAFSGEAAESKFSVSQRLFDGFKRISAIKYSGVQIRVQEILYKDIMRNLYFNTAQAFYAVAGIEADAKNLNDIAVLLADRVKELNERVRLGKSRESEVLATESQIDVYNSQIAQDNGSRKAALESLSFLTGVDSEQLKINDDAAEIKEVEPLEKTLEAAINRSDLKALREAVLAQTYRVRIAKGGFLPSIGLNSSRYFVREGITYSGISWDVLLSLDFPLYQGGFDAARVKEETSNLHEIEFQQEQLARQVRTQIKTLHSAVVTSIATVASLKEAYNKAEQSYQSQLSEYRLGLVNNLDVLQAAATLINVKRSLDGAIIGLKTNKALLDISVERY